jgi:hypothetical protein
MQLCFLMNGLAYGSSKAQDATLQAMNEDLMKIQGAVYYGLKQAIGSLVA